jgi:hypothetical protein
MKEGYESAVKNSSSIPSYLTDCPGCEPNLSQTPLLRQPGDWIVAKACTVGRPSCNYTMDSKLHLTSVGGVK